jgi:hypothetical protein
MMKIKLALSAVAVALTLAACSKQDEAASAADAAAESATEAAAAASDAVDSAAAATEAAADATMEAAAAATDAAAAATDAAAGAVEPAPAQYGCRQPQGSPGADGAGRDEPGQVHILSGLFVFWRGMIRRHDSEPARCARTCGGPRMDRERVSRLSG